MAAYKGLTTRNEVVPGDRTPYSKNVPFATSHISCGDERVEIKGEMVFPFSAQKCFNMMKDYRQFLLTSLKDNERVASERIAKQFHAKPLWLFEEENGTVGSLVEYAYYINDVVYWMVDKVITLEDGIERDMTKSKNKIFRFACETQCEKSRPTFPLKGFSTFMIFTTFNEDPNQCHLTWIKKWNKPFLGLMSVNDSFQTVLQGNLQRELNNFWVLLHSTYSPSLPKKDSKVLVIGAGPSGLHMTYELIQRGMDENNFTILEKDDRYGGKTLSIKMHSNVQISDPKYNAPPPKAAAIPQIEHALKKWYTCKAIREAVEMWWAGNLNAVELAEIKRRNTPNALQSQPKDEYFLGGEQIFHELGTCYLSPGYYAIRTLLRRIQDQIEAKAEQEGNDQGKWSKIAKADMTREVGPDTYAIESSDWKGALSLEDWIVHAGKDYTKLDDYCPRNPALQAVAVNSTVLEAKLKYCKLHNEYLGNYTYTMPMQPDDARFEEVLMTFQEFLDKNDLLTMEPLFTYALTAQGYGVIKSTPTFLAMQWLTPDLLDGYFEWYYFFMLYKDSAGDLVKPIPDHLKKFDNFRKGMLVSGWGGLWDRIVALYDLEPKIKFKTEIHHIQRKQDGKVHVKYTYKGRCHEETYDFLVVGAPLSDAAEDATKPTLPLDFTEDEREIFLNKDVKASKFRTTLFRPEKNGTYEIDHLRIFIDSIMAPKNAPPEADAGHGMVFGVRDSYKAIQPRLSTQGGHEYDPGNEIVREKMLYQYVSPESLEEYGGEEFLMKTFQNFMLQHPEYFRNGDRLGTEMTHEIRERIMKMYMSSKAWTYYTHFEKDALKNGNLWKTMDLQGKKNTFFVHASTNFESVLDIVNYNHMILDGLQGRLDDFIPPETDTRPAPWQRPQVLLLGQSWGFNIFKYVMNFFLFILWSAVYVVTYPFAEGIYLRYARWNLQNSYKTPELGKWWTYNMSVFNDVSPTLRGWFDYYEGRPNGMPKTLPPDYDPMKWTKELGPGDTVFKIVQAPKNGFAFKHPSIPGYKEIPASIFWNFTDMRLALRCWLSTFEDSFMPFLTPKLQDLLFAVSSYVPSLYSWIFSWIFATQFRLLIGFSYRFEDEKGGGLRIPDCNMLRTAIRDHGVEIGQRTCLTICKIFTEETMRKKKFKIDFQPDFIEGGGFGCKVRMENPVNNAFSNHSLYKLRTKKEKEAFKDIDLSW